jgi:hypothetical protein
VAKCPARSRGGLDVHKDEVVACARVVTGDRVERTHGRFPTTTRGLLALADWLERGRTLLEHHRMPDREPTPHFYDGPSKARELTHDAQLYRAYLRSADRLHAQGASHSSRGAR